MGEMIEVFKDESIMNSPVKVIMVNAFGKEECGVDDGGVLRDALSAFWCSFMTPARLGRKNECQQLGMISRTLNGHQQLVYWSKDINW